MSAEQQLPRAIPAIRRPIRGERIAVAAVLTVAVGLSLASLIANPASAPTLAMASLYGIVGTILALRRPRNPIGWLFLGVLLVFTVTPAADAFGGAAARAGAPLPDGLPLLLIWVETWAFGALFGIYYGLTVIFPSGRLPGGRVGRIVRISLLVPIAAVVVGAFGPHLAGNFSSQYIGRDLANPAAVLPFPQRLDSLLQIATIVLLICGAVSMIVRFRRATGIEREQLKWLVASLALTGVLIVATVAVVLAVPQVGTSVWVLAVLGYATIPPAVGVAVLRYRLYDIDRIVSRTVAWGIVTAVLVTVFAGVILVTQALLSSLTGADTLAVAVSTLIVAALFRPLLSAVQGRVDRRFNRGRYDAERTVAAFGSLLRDEIELGRLSEEIAAAVNVTVQPASLVVWFRG